MTTFSKSLLIALLAFVASLAYGPVLLKALFP